MKLESLTSTLTTSQLEDALRCLRIDQGTLRVRTGQDTPGFEAILDLLAAIDPQRQGVPVSHLGLSFLGISNAQLQTLCAAPWFVDVQVLNLAHSRVSAKALAFVQAAPGLRALDISHVKIGRGVGRLSGLAALESLSLGFCGIDAKASVALGKADLPSLRCLDLSGWGAHLTATKLNAAVRDGVFEPFRVGRDMVKGVFAGSWPATLRELTLRAVHLDRGGCAAFGRADLCELEQLRIYDCRIDLSGPMICDLPSLRVLRSEAGIDGTTLAAAAFLPTLECLDLSGGAPSEDLLCTTLAQTPCLRELRLKGMGVGRALVDALVQHGPPLSALSLPWNQLDDGCVERLCEARFMPDLKRLALSNNPIGGGALRALAAGRLSLEALSLRNTNLSSAEIEPLWSASWILGLSRLNLHDNRLDSAVIPQLLRLPCTLTLHVANNVLDGPDVHSLQAHFGSNLGRTSQSLFKRGRPRPPYAGPGLRFTYKSVFDEKQVQPPSPPVWVQERGHPVVARSTRAFVVVRDGTLDVLLSWKKQVIPLDIPSPETPVLCNPAYGDGPVFIAVPGEALFSIDLYKGVVVRVRDLAVVHDLVEVPAASGSGLLGIALTHGTPPVLEFFGPRPPHRSMASIGVEDTGLSTGVSGAVVACGPRDQRPGPVRFFAAKPSGLEAIAHLDAGLAVVPGGVALEGHVWTPSAV